MLETTSQKLARSTPGISCSLLGVCVCVCATSHGKTVVDYISSS